jgi:hypothetical protein
MSRVPFSFIKSSNVFDISTLNLTAWVRAGNYNSGTGTWTGTASAGTSGTHNFTNGGSTKPTAGSNLNGLGTVAFAAASTQFLSCSGLLSTFLSASAYSTWALINNTSSTGAAAKTAAYSNGAVISDSASYWAQAVSTTNSGVAQIYQWDGAGQGQEAALTNSTWSLIQTYYDGTNQFIRVNSGAWVSGASGNIQLLGGSVLYLASNYNGTKYFDGVMADVGTSATAFSQATFDNIKSALNSRYALSL